MKSSKSPNNWFEIKIKIGWFKMILNQNQNSKNRFQITISNRFNFKSYPTLPKSLLRTFLLFSVAVCLQKFCQYSPKTVFFEPVQVLNQSLVSTAKWHITSLVYRHCIKNYYLRQYHLLLFINLGYVWKIKHNSIFVWKLIKLFQKMIFLHMHYSDFSKFFLKIMFYMVV